MALLRGRVGICHGAPGDQIEVGVHLCACAPLYPPIDLLRLDYQVRYGLSRAAGVIKVRFVSTQNLGKLYTFLSRIRVFFDIFGGQIWSLVISKLNQA